MISCFHNNTNSNIDDNNRIYDHDQNSNSTIHQSYQ